MKLALLTILLGCSTAQAGDIYGGYPTQQDAFYRTQEAIDADRERATDRAAAARRARQAETDAWLEQYAIDHKVQMLEERIRQLERNKQD